MRWQLRVERPATWEAWVQIATQQDPAAEVNPTEQTIRFTRTIHLPGVPEGFRIGPTEGLGPKDYCIRVDAADTGRTFPAD